MTKYRKIPVVIDAVQWTGNNKADIEEFIGKDAKFSFNLDKGDLVLIIHTLEGDITVSIDDYIVRGVDGEYYPCKPDIFKKTYEPIHKGFTD